MIRIANAKNSIAKQYGIHREELEVIFSENVVYGISADPPKAVVDGF